MKYLSKLLLILLLFASCKGTLTTSESINGTSSKVQTPETPNAHEITSRKEIDTIITKSAEKVKTITQEQTKSEEPQPKSALEKTQSEITEAFNHSVWHELLQAHVTEQGNLDYEAFKANQQVLKNYINSLSQLLPDDTWTRNDVLAYWINAYNALTVDLIIRNYPVKSIKDIKDPWDQRLWKLGNKWYNLNDIEHQILRKMDEPRIHFAIVCASFSCPKLQKYAFTAANLENQLTESTRTFLADTNRNIITENELKLSRIFQWFTKDFKQNGSVLDFINTYTNIEINPKAKTSYLDYNWDLNE